VEEDHWRGIHLRRRRVPQLARLVRPTPKTSIRVPLCAVFPARFLFVARLNPPFPPCREHQHMHKPPEYPYLRIRNKPLPWGDGSKDLLDVRHEYVEDEHH
jgi:hypothetical protein